MKNISDKVVEKFKTQTSCSITSLPPPQKKKVPFKRKCGIMFQNRAGHR